MSEMRKENKMGTMPVGRLLLSMSWPAMISMIIMAMYNIVDSVFVAQLGEDALAAVTYIFPAQLLMMSVGIGTGVGVNSLISRRLGARRFEEADLAASCGVKLGILNWIVFAILGAFFSDEFMNVFSENTAIVDMGTQYLRIVSTMCIFVMLSCVCEKITQSTGSMKFPMIASISGTVVNIALDPIMIFGLFGCPRMEVAGAAIATIIGQCVQMAINMYFAFRKIDDVTISLKEKLFDKQTVKDIYVVGGPAIVMQAIGSVMQFGMNKIVGGFSDTAVAVSGVYGRLQSFVFMPTFGINQGSMPILGYNYGARNPDRLMKTFKYAFCMAFGVMFVGLLAFQFAPHLLLSMFNASEDMYDIGTSAFRIISWCFLPAAFGITTGGVFSATGHGFLSLFASLVRQLIGILPLAYLFSKIGSLNLVWASFPLAEIIGLVYSGVMIRRLYVRDISKLRDGVQEV